jgi:hypothetical protein
MSWDCARLADIFEIESCLKYKFHFKNGNPVLISNYILFVKRMPRTYGQVANLASSQNSEIPR